MTTPRDVAVQVHIADPWASVPLRLMEAGCGLTPLARLVLIYVLDLGRRPDWKIYASHARRALGLTEARWKRARRELEDHGYFTKHRGHAADGDWLWTYHVYDTPQSNVVEDNDQLSIGRFCTDAKSTGAKQADRRNKTSHSSTQHKKKEAAAEAPREERAAPAPAAPGAAASGDKEPRRQPRIVAGCTCWTPEDPQLVEELAKVHGPDSVIAVAGELRAAGIDPLPSVVARVLQERARVSLQSAAERKAEQQDSAQRKAREAEQAERAARRDDPETRARITALITETARRVGFRT